jgi:hypothetical protein
MPESGRLQFAARTVHACKPLIFVSRLTTVPNAVTSSVHDRTPVTLAPDAICGTRLTREECAPSASTNGLRPNVARVLGGRSILIGMRSDSAFACECVMASSCYQKSPFRA